MRHPNRLLLLLWLLPALIAWAGWLLPASYSFDLATGAEDERLNGFYEPEQAGSERYRWARPGATLELPAHALPGVLELRAALPPEGRPVALSSAGLRTPLPPAGAARFRRYQLLLPAGGDALGHTHLTIDAAPGSRGDDPRELALALSRLELQPVSGPRAPPPIGALLILGLLPAIAGLFLGLAGVPLGRTASLAGGVALALVWAREPEQLRPLLLDSATLATNAELWRWWLACTLAGLAALPLAQTIFRDLPLAAYPFARVLGILLGGYLAWLMALVRLAPFSTASVALSLGTVFVAGFVLRLPRRGAGAAAPSGKLTTHNPKRSFPSLSPILFFELLFLAGLCAGVWLRWHGAVGPAIYGTEKPMELALLASITRSPTFPPHDPWFAGYPLNYYYLGYGLLAALQSLAGVETAVAFNLGLATIVALTTTTLAGIITALIRLTTPHSRSLALPLLAVVLVLVAGNQVGALQLLLGSNEARALDGPQTVTALTARLTGSNRIELEPPAGVRGAPTLIEPGEPGSFDWFTPSRAVWDDLPDGAGQLERRYVITEFPFFSFYLGDLHPHVLTLPFSLLALAIALAAAARHERPGLPYAIADTLIAGIAIGSLYAINSWDAPIYALLYTGAALREGLRGLWRVAATGLAALLAALPFLLSFTPPAGPPGTGLLAGLPLGRTFALTPAHTQLHGFIIIFGLFFVPLLAYAWGGWRMPRRRWLDPRGLIILASVLALAFGTAAGQPLLALLPLAAGLVWRAWAERERSAQAFVLWGIAVGALIIFAADTVYVRDHQEAFMPRMITTFKLYYQAWLLWGTLAAYALWALLQPPLRTRLTTLAWSLPTALLLAGALVYPIATLSRGEPWLPGERSLDGLSYLRRSAPAELAAMEWLAANAAPDAIVLTAFCNCDYDEIGRVGAITGLQTMLGWLDGHETLWRSGNPAQLAEIRRREQLIPLIYETTDTTATERLLEQEQISYVYIGAAERRLHGGPGLAKFATFMERVFAAGTVEVYARRGATEHAEAQPAGSRQVVE